MVLENAPRDACDLSDQDPAQHSTAASPPSALQALGWRLRQAREAQGLSREQLAERLHMGPEQFAALEEGRRDCLPEAAFVIAQARRIAGALALSIDAEVEALRRDPAFTPSAPASLAAPRPAAAPRPVAPLSSLAVGSPAASSPAPVAAPSTGPRPRGLPAWILRGAIPTAGLVALAALALQGRQRVQGQGPAPQSPAEQQSPPERSAGRIGGRQMPVATGLPPASAGSPVLVLDSRGPSWLEVTTGEPSTGEPSSGGGRLLFRGTLEGQRRFPLAEGVRVLAGRPDLVTVRIGAGPAQPLGPIDQVRWRRFTAPAP